MGLFDLLTKAKKKASGDPSISNPLGYFSGQNFGWDPGAMALSLANAKSQADLIGSNAMNRIRGSFKDRGIPSQALFNASREGARQGQQAYSELVQPLQIGGMQAGAQGRQFGAQQGVNLFDIMRRREDQIKAAQAAKQKGFNLGLPGGKSVGYTW